jgi:MFS transporter, ACS family, hexuronate transporter
MLWLFFWLAMYRKPSEHKKLRPSELQYIQSDPADPPAKVKWARLIPLRQTWAFSVGKFLTDPIWWFFLFWTPSFFKENFGYGLDKISLPLIVIYLVADVGSIGGGWLSSHFIKRGWSVNKARKTAMFICALCVVPVFTAGMTRNPWVAVAVISLALGAHQGWSCNLFTLVSDTFPRFAVGSVVGIGGMAGAIGGLLMSEGVGQVLKEAVRVQGQTAYMPMFIAASGMYLFTLLIIHLLVPRLQPAKLDTKV